MRDVGYGWCMQVVDVCLVGYALEDVEREREQETGTVQDPYSVQMARGNSRGVALKFHHVNVNNIMV